MGVARRLAAHGLQLLGLLAILPAVVDFLGNNNPWPGIALWLGLAVNLFLAGTLLNRRHKSDQESYRVQDSQCPDHAPRR
jgi:hypothetical protein